MEREIIIHKDNFNKSLYQRFTIVGDVGGENTCIGI